MVSSGTRMAPGYPGTRAGPKLFSAIIWVLPGEKDLRSRSTRKEPVCQNRQICSGSCVFAVRAFCRSRWCFDVIKGILIQLYVTVPCPMTQLRQTLGPPTREKTKKLPNSVSSGRNNTHAMRPQTNTRRKSISAWKPADCRHLDTLCRVGGSVNFMNGVYNPVPPS